jgi:hypothetical protein
MKNGQNQLAARFQISSTKKMRVKKSSSRTNTSSWKVPGSDT